MEVTRRSVADIVAPAAAIFFTPFNSFLFQFSMSTVEKAMRRKIRKGSKGSSPGKSEQHPYSY